MLPCTLLLCLWFSLFNPHSCYFWSLWSFPYFPPQDFLKNPLLPICLDTHRLFFAISFPSDSLKKMKTCLSWGVEMGKDCATILTGFEELQKGEIEKRFGMQRQLPAIRSRDQLIIICTPTILIIIIIIIINHNSYHHHHLRNHRNPHHYHLKHCSHQYSDTQKPK